VRTGRALTVLRGHRGAVDGVAFGDDDRRIVTASADGTARIWDVRSRRALRTFSHEHNDVLSADLSSDGTRLVTVDASGSPGSGMRVPAHPVACFATPSN